MVSEALRPDTPGTIANRYRLQEVKENRGATFEEAALLRLFGGALQMGAGSKQQAARSPRRRRVLVDRQNENVEDEVAVGGDQIAALWVCHGRRYH